MQKANRSIYILPALFLLLAGCTPSAPPTPSPEEVANQVATSVALTVQALDAMATSAAQTMEAQMPTEPAQTEEPEPPPTPTNLSTNTPIVIVPTTGSGGGGGFPSKPQFACDIIHQRPFDNTVFRPNDPFDVKWTIVNTGTDTWPKGYDLTYFSGPHMIKNPVLIELPEMKPGAQFVVPVFDAFAPKERGFHVETWKLQGGFCYPYIAINVE